MAQDSREGYGGQMITITYDEPLEKIRLAIQAAGLNAYVGTLPPAAGVSLVITGGAVTHDLAGNIMARLTLGVNVKAHGQEDANQMLGTAQAAFNRLTDSGDNWQITGASMQSGAVQVASDPQGWFLFSSTATLRIAYWEHDPPPIPPPTPDSDVPAEDEPGTDEPGEENTGEDEEE